MTELEQLQFEAWLLKVADDTFVSSNFSGHTTREADEARCAKQREARRTVTMLKAKGIKVPYPHVAADGKVYQQDGDWENGHEGAGGRYLFP